MHLKQAPQAAHEFLDYTPSSSTYRAVFKQVFDIAFVIALLPVILPAIAVLSFLIALDGHNPFFVQPRVGRDGRIFSMIKLRSMVANAEEHLVRHLEANPEAKREWDEKQKLRNDPRITWIGRLIRRTSMDELPQFFNVLLGDMSVVGPRPILPSQRELYPGQAYYVLKPGVTGFWQVGDRHSTNFADRARYDSQYYGAISLRTDITVVLQTVKVVVSGTGA